MWEKWSQRARSGELDIPASADEIIAHAARTSHARKHGGESKTAQQLKKKTDFVEFIYRKSPAHNHLGTRSDFLEFMRLEFNLASSPIVQLLHRVWDAVNVDNEELVPWKAMFSGLAQVMAGTMDDKASFYFSLHDTDGNGDMDKQEILGLILSSQRAAAAAAQKAISLLTQLDQDGDGQITFEEFKVGCAGAWKPDECGPLTPPSQSSRLHPERHPRCWSACGSCLAATKTTPR